MEINLLSPKYQQAARWNFNLPLNILGIVTAVIISSFFVGYGLILFLDYQTRNKLVEIEKETAILQPINRKLQSEASWRQAVDYKEGFIKAIEQEKPVFSGVIEQSRKLLPIGTVITNFEIKSTGDSSNYEINIDGEAPSYLSASQFGRNLQENMFLNGSIINTSKKDDAKNVVAFSIRITGVKGRVQ